MNQGYSPLSGSAKWMAGPRITFRVAMRSGSMLLLSNLPSPSPPTSTLSMVRARTIDFDTLGSGDVDVPGRVVLTRYSHRRERESLGKYYEI